MGILAVSVLGVYKFLTNLIKRQGYSQGFLSKWLQNFVFNTDISEMILQNRVERRLFELHSMLQCRDNCQSIEQEMHPHVCVFIRIQTCTYLAAVISALGQAMKLKLAPFYYV